MYHYVRDLKLSKYKKLKVLKIEDFKKQIKYLKKNYTFFNPNNEIKNYLKKRICWLTFDDGYIDHYNFVLPILEENKIKASFFISSNIENKKILEVNKIQFILEKKNSKDLLNEIKILYNSILRLNSNAKIDQTIKKIKFDHRYDTKETIIVKRLLQRDLNQKIRKQIINLLFKKYVENNEVKFHKELYMNVKHLKIIKKLGHEIGNHTQSHEWLSRLNKNNQNLEINKNLIFLRKHKLINKKWTMCYPFGDYNAYTLEVLRKLNCSRALTTQVGPTTNRSNLLKLPRLNTNDFYPINKN
jgi:peptidoglycan/xylan/chitin deacetylase (PgdA/CDA1 family)